MKITNQGFAVIEGDTHASQQVIDMGTMMYEPDYIKRIQSLLKPGDVCVDAGACIGAYSRGMKDKVGEHGTVYSFEPNPAAFECLQHNCPDCVIFNRGLSGSTQDRVIHPGVNAGGTWFSPIRGSKESDVVRFEALDQMQLVRLDFFKIDVEGMEFLALLGAKDTLVRCRPIVWLEINHIALARQHSTYLDVIKPMLSLGYTMNAVQNATLRVREWPQLDIVFTPMA